MAGRRSITRQTSPRRSTPTRFSGIRTIVARSPAARKCRQLFNPELVADNTLPNGHVLDPGDPIAAFDGHVAADPRSSQVLLTVRDGMTLIRRA